VKQAASATLLQLIFRAERLVTWTSWRKLYFDYRMEVSRKIFSVVIPPVDDGIAQHNPATVGFVESSHPDEEVMRLSIAH
jgi:hypothetical protein